MTTEEIAAAIFLGLVVLYLAARLITAAFFKSKQQYEKDRNHGT
jgi:hypothetical protein